MPRIKAYDINGKDITKQVQADASKRDLVAYIKDVKTGRLLACANRYYPNQLP